MKKLKPKTQSAGSKRIYKQVWQCKDGPWKGQCLYLESKHTLVMNINGTTGRYVGGVWEQHGEMK